MFHCLLDPTQNNRFSVERAPDNSVTFRSYSGKGSTLLATEIPELTSAIAALLRGDKISYRNQRTGLTIYYDGVAALFCIEIFYSDDMGYIPDSPILSCWISNETLKTVLMVALT